MRHKSSGSRLLHTVVAVAFIGVWALSLIGAPPTDADMLVPFPHPKGYVCHRTISPITIDGTITNAEWGSVPWTDPFVDIEGDKQPKPRFQTRVKMLWDDEALYVAAELEEPHVWATLKEHDSIIFYDNDFELFLDPDGDNHLYAELEVNAHNTTWDLLLPKPYKDLAKAVNAWEISGLKTAIKVHGTLNDPRDKDTGWSIEVRWPWAGLKELATVAMPPKDGDQWRINFSRVEWDIDIVDGKYQKVPKKPEYNWVWSQQGVIDMHRPERWGYLQFSTGKTGKAEFRPDAEWDTRDLLHRTYYAQRAYKKANGRYATAMSDLGLKDKIAAQLTLDACRTAFEASVSLPTENGAKPKRMAISQDSKLVKE
ncbi:MAG: hypothetical protein C0467_21745 [Planctomycetaceae bacterium]|nr:hypothetical protein [Planctomycetaceae bacterium]